MIAGCLLPFLGSLIQANGAPGQLVLSCARRRLMSQEIRPYRVTGGRHGPRTPQVRDAAQVDDGRCRDMRAAARFSLRPKISARAAFVEGNGHCGGRLLPGAAVGMSIYVFGLMPRRSPLLVSGRVRLVTRRPPSSPAAPARVAQPSCHWRR